MNPPSLIPRSKLAVGFLGLCVFAALASLWAENEQLSFMSQVVNGGRVSLAQARSVDDHAQLIGGIELIAYLPAVIAFLLWFSRAYRSITPLTGGARWKPRDAVIYWFIPFLGTVRAKQAMNDLWRAGDPELPRNVDRTTLAARPVSPLVNWWWAALLLSSAAYRIGMTAGRNEPTAAQRLHAQLTGQMVADAVQVVAGVLAIIVVQSITARLEGRRGVAAVPPPPPAFAPPEPVRDISGSFAPPGF